MQILFRTFLAIYFAHLLTDFVFQSNVMAARKRAGNPKAYLQHGAIHYILAVLVTAFFIKGAIVRVVTNTVLLALTAVHLAIDFAKIRLTSKRVLRDGSLAYAGDQLLHLLTVFAAALLLAPSSSLRQLFAALESARSAPNKLIAIPVVYIIVVFGGGYFIRFVTASLARGLKNGSPEKTGEHLQNAGLYIGWLERFLVLTALLLQSPATVGLLLTAKSIARYPEFHSERFAEYFLIGTLLSLSIALLGGALLARILFGHVRLAA